jgi:hypothetical protein
MIATLALVVVRGCDPEKDVEVHGIDRTVSALPLGR